LVRAPRPGEGTGDRLQKVLAHAGVASRRAAEELILAGRVSVNGEVVAELGRRVRPADRIEVDGKPLAPSERLVYVALNKPVGYVSTARDPEGRPTVLDLVGRSERLYPVGRLDWDSEGLLLLSNDGALTHRLTHPRYGVEKEYHALVAGYPSGPTLQTLADGVRLEDGLTAPAGVRRLRQDKHGVWLAIRLHEGRNRQVRRMLEAVGHPAKRLIRVRVGPVELGGLPPGRRRDLLPAEVAALRRAAALTPSAAAGP
jgi:pseudouridine synthase